MARALDYAIKQYAYQRGQGPAPRIPKSWTRSQRGAYKSWLSKLEAGYQPTQRPTKKRWGQKIEKAGLYQELRPHIVIGSAHYSLIQGRDIKDLIGMVLKFSYDKMVAYHKTNESYFGKGISEKYFHSFLNRLNKIYEYHDLGESPEAWNTDLKKFRKIKVRVYYAL